MGVLTLLIGIQSWVLFIVLLTISCELKWIETDQIVPSFRFYFFCRKKINWVEIREFGKIRHTYVELECTGQCTQHYHKNIWIQYLISIVLCFHSVCNILNDKELFIFDTSTLDLSFSLSSQITSGQNARQTAAPHWLRFRPRVCHEEEIPWAGASSQPGGSILLRGNGPNMSLSSYTHKTQVYCKLWALGIQ